jgi:hypothetical protein
MTNLPDHEKMTPELGASIGVSEHIAAARLGVSLSTLRRDRKDGRLGGVPFLKYGEGRRSAVRYVVADLENFIAAKRRRAVPPLPETKPVVEIEPVPIPDPPAPELAQPSADARRAAALRRIEELTARAKVVEMPDDPFASASRPSPHRPGGYWSR